MIVKIRASVFIPMCWTDPVKDMKTGKVKQFEGDSREFTPHAVNTMRSRVEQEVTVDFHKKELFCYKNTGITTEKVIDPDGSIHLRQGKASTDGIQCTDIVWGTNEVSFQMSASASNPLNELAPTVDYLLAVKVIHDGTIYITGKHDGFPCFEFYEQINFCPYETIYTYDFRNTGETPAAMAGEMEYKFKKIL